MSHVLYRAVRVIQIRMHGGVMRSEEGSRVRKVRPWFGARARTSKVPEDPSKEAINCAPNFERMLTPTLQSPLGPHTHGDASRAKKPLQLTARDSR